MYNAVKGFVSRLGFASSSSFSSNSGFSDGGANPPLDSIFYWPFFTGSLDETIEGIDATFTNSTDNVPTFDSNGLVLDSANSDSALAPVSTSQVDSNHGLSGTTTIDLTSGDAKYAGHGGADWVGVVWKSGNVITAICTSGNADELTVTGTVSITDKMFFHTSSFPDISAVKTLRNSVGDEGGNADARYYDFDGEYIDIPAMELAGDDLDVSFDINLADSGTVRTIMRNALNTSAILITGAGALRIDIDGFNTVLVPSGVIPTGADCSVRIKRTGSTYIVTINGVDQSPIVGNSATFDIDRICTSIEARAMIGVLRNLNINNERLYRINDGKGSTEIVESIGGQNGTPVGFSDDSWLGGWVDTPVNDFYREVEFYINYLDDKFKCVIYRSDLSSTNYEGIGYIEKSGDLSVGYLVQVGASLDLISVEFTPAQYDLTKPFIVRTEKRSGVSTTITVAHNGITLTDVIGISRDIIQQNYDMLDNVESAGDTLSQTIVSSAVGAL